MIITMSHGSGGKSSNDLIEEVFKTAFKNPALDRLEDAAILDISDTKRIAFSTDSFVVNPIIFKGGDIGKLAVCGTVNDLLMMGAVPKYLSVGFILEEGLEIELLKKIVDSMAKEAKKAGVQIVAGDTKVVEGSGGLYINTSGIGYIDINQNISASSCKPGDKVILSGTLGNHHACILSHRMGIDNEIKSDCALLTEMVRGMINAGIRIRTMRDVTRGGLGTIMNEIAGSSDVAIVIHEEAFPVDLEIKGFCEILGLDPMYMGNEGKFVCIVESEDSEKALEIIRSSEFGEKAEIIGEVIEGNASVSLETRLGGKRIIDVLYGEGLPRIC